MTSNRRTSVAETRIPPPLIYLAGFVVGLVVQIIEPLPRLSNRPATVIGIVSIAAGSIVAPWAVVLFRRAETTLDPAAMTTALVTNGPYRLTRNPIYLGFTLLYAGAAVWSGTTWALAMLAVVLVVVDRRVVRGEERKLHDTFGSGYGDYQSQVRRWL